MGRRAARPREQTPGLSPVEAPLNHGHAGYEAPAGKEAPGGSPATNNQRTTKHPIIRRLGRSILARILRARGAWSRRLVGWAWLALWAGVLDLIHRPWHELGGLLTEHMRWLERVVLGASFLVGCFVGSFVRDAAGAIHGRPHLDSLRFVWIPPAALVAAAIVVCHHLGLWHWTLLVLAGFVAYWAGLDAAVGAWPLARGRHYSPIALIEIDRQRGHLHPELEEEDD